MKKNSLSFAVLISVLIFLLTHVSALDSSVTVTPPTGPIIGYLDPTGTNYEFRGIPYASASRWEASQLLSPWSTPFNASTDGVGFPQVCALPPHTCPEKTDEDAFFLNVYKPTTNTKDLKPVMVYFHGGNFYQGFGSGCTLYNGQKYVQLVMFILSL